MTPLKWPQLFPWKPWDWDGVLYARYVLVFDMAEAIHLEVCNLSFEIQWAIEEE